MRTYWDTSALLEVILGSPTAREAFVAGSNHFTRAHTLAEAFSHLTSGRLSIRLSANDATRTLRAFASKMEIVSLSGEQVLKALDEAQRRGVRGGGVHDYLHVIAAELHGAARVYTYNVSDFCHLTKLPIVAP